LRHLGRGGVSKSFFTCVDEFEKKYSRVFKRRKIRTTCTKVYVGATRLEIFFRYWIRFSKRKKRLLIASKQAK